MNIRRYNIYFHTHTISGILICALLYVIFFAGSFTFFREEISAWQKNFSYSAHKGIVKKDYNFLVDSLSTKYNLTGRDFSFYVNRNDMATYVDMSVSADTTISKKNPETEGKKGRRGRRGGNEDSAYFTYDFAKKSTSDYASSYDMGEFLYRLHFLAQLNQIPINIGTPFGYLLAGLVSFLFLFALITGVFLHWDKIKSNFFIFRPWSKWKTVWTDIHTALGVIGFPFQFMFAVTGVILIINFVLIMPYSKVLYKGDTEKVYQALQYSDDAKYEYSYQALNTKFDLNAFVEGINERWPGSTISRMYVRNYNDANMHIIVEAKPDADINFSGAGKLVYRVKDQKVLSEKTPHLESSYLDHVKALIYHLHFGDYGGRALKIIYFVLGVMGCVVIISGILIWLVARDKTNVPAHKRKFNFWTANVFLASCLTMLPVTAFTFIVLRFLNTPTQSDIYHWYFYSWLVLAVYFIVRRDIALTNRQTVFLSILLCLGVPLANGIMTGSWPWATYRSGAFDILFIDLLFFALSLVSLYVYIKIRKRKYTA
ncbi:MULTISPECIES: PepSY-associated TM helix domain-containing protein [unclassified Sphingobacterium]|uniref:PepSY-associated TM helix domain-containing protein n=1 Tax=unclassified Sphingobacterium TaxID=2609468 RepID=UPI0025CC1303|nr:MULTISPECIES: PepSY-associated TM helix domain-containing protein [unclassified Sphingobacterium]